MPKHIIIRAISKLRVDNYNEALQDLEVSQHLGYSKASEVISRYYPEKKK